VTRLFAAALALLLAGCFPVQYMGQAAGGQLGILRAARPIPEAVRDAEVPARTRRLLLAVPEIKAFGQAQGLRPTPSYRSYADLRRPAAVWVVQACKPLSFDVRTWRLPVVGTIPYLGFFDPADARRHADALAAAEGLDVDVRSASAYSTLGWFHDPVLSTMIPEGPDALGELANVVLHESVHATLYVNDQSAFDESLANFVADRLTLPWLAHVLGPDAPEARGWAQALAAYRTRVARLRRAHAELDALYRSGASDDEKRSRKAEILAAATAELGLRRPLNNASLAGYETYESGTQGFERLLAACGGSFPRFMGTLTTLREDDFARPQQRQFDDVLERLARDGCAAPPPPSRGPEPGRYP
jgi:predicted aminopeptidase